MKDPKLKEQGSDITVQVKAEARHMGADLVGIAPVSRWQHAPRMLSPQAHLPDARSVVVMGIHHPDASVEWCGLPNSNYIGPCQIGMIAKLDSMAWRMARFLEKQGAPAVPFSCTGYWRHRPYKEIKTDHTASFSHRHAAVAAGLGEFGLNNMFMSPTYGPRERVISVITTAELIPDPLYSGAPLCDQCRMCAKHCPGRNYEPEHLLKPGTDKVVIEDKTYNYAKLNRWRCIWGEQFALDMDQLAAFNITDEESIYRAQATGARFRGWEFGNCLRFCMAKPVRYWDRKYTAAPRRKKEKGKISTEELLKKIRALARSGGADRLMIHPLSAFPSSEMTATPDYPVEKMRRNFSWVITCGRRIMPLPGGHALLEDCEAYINAASHIRLTMAAYDIASYLDNSGFEAMQDWMRLGAKVLKQEKWDEVVPEVPVYHFDPEEEKPLPRSVRFPTLSNCKPKAGNAESQIIADAKSEPQQKQKDVFASWSVICEAPLQSLCERLESRDAQLSLNEFGKASFLSPVDKVGIVSVDKIPSLPGIIDIRKVLPGARSLIVLLTAVPEQIVTLAGKQEAECAASYSYLQYQILSELLWSAHDLADWLKKQGQAAVPLADVSLRSFRTLEPYSAFGSLGHPDPRANAPLAALSGLGEIGKNGLLLTPEYGPRHKLVFVLTTAALPETKSYQGPKLCRPDCDLCAVACPVQALSRKIASVTDGRGGEYQVFPRQEQRCRWARSLGMVGAEGPETIGWRKPDLPVPDELNETQVWEAINSKDPLQVKGYKGHCMVDTIVERCLQACPVGRCSAKE